jgi:hypothetical protein
MEYIWSSEIDPILSVGRSLTSMGVRNWVLKQHDILVVLEQLSVMNVAVLGGDVYVVNGNNVELNYDNWFCNRENGEAKAHFVERSITKARNYIASYQSKTENVLFAIVPEITAE